MATRTFQDKLAVREMTPLLIGLAGASGSGKTASALRLATGIQRICGGEIWGIDTEANRMLHYAPGAGEKVDPAKLIFSFRHLPFPAPFGPLDYLAAITHCASKGAGIIIVDSLSHEHEGPGGVLEIHAAEEVRLQGNAAAKFTAWQKPKEARRRLINSILQMPINFIFCFRAKEKIKPEKKKAGEEKGGMQELGWMPIGGEEYVYEMTVNCLLYPNSGGIPTWNPVMVGEKAMVKLPAQFTGVFKDSTPLSEEIGEALALWASGGITLPSNWHSVRVAEANKTTELELPDQKIPCATCKANVPRCRECKKPQDYVRAGVSRKGGPYEAFWVCPEKCPDSRDKRRNTSIKAAIWHERLMRPPESLTETPPSNLTPPGSGVEGGTGGSAPTSAPPSNPDTLFQDEPGSGG